MRNPERIDRILDNIREIWKQNPDLRLMQLLLNINLSADPYYIEDDILEKELEYYKKNSK
jgi:uncharacterized protein YihD (DUF1040 family)